MTVEVEEMIQSLQMADENDLVIRGPDKDAIIAKLRAAQSLRDAAKSACRDRYDGGLDVAIKRYDDAGKE